MELCHCPLPEALFLPGLNSSPTELLLGLVCSLAGYLGFFGFKLLGLKLGFLRIHMESYEKKLYA
jgi:hypothetical protein